jgi:hypothetical protein
MGINDKCELIAELKGICNDTARVPRSRIVAARRLLRETEHSVRSVKVAKRVAKLFMTDMNASSVDRKSAQSLYEFAMGAKNEHEEEDAELPEKLTAIVEPDAPNTSKVLVDTRTREQKLADANEGWDDPVAPRKLLTFYEPKDLLQYGINLDDPNVTYYVDPGMLDWLPSKIYNPNYAKAFAAWKQKRFNGVTPDRWSRWRLLFESDISAYPDCQPKEQLCGAMLMARMAQSREIEPWETDFLWDLHWDIVMQNRRDEPHIFPNTMATPGFDWSRARGLNEKNSTYAERLDYIHDLPGCPKGPGSFDEASEFFDSEMAKMRTDYDGKKADVSN